MRDEAVRVSAFHGLRTHLGESDLRPIDLALKAEKSDVGRLAVQALESLATRDDQALARLVGTLDAKTAEVRLAAVVGLESAHDPRSPESNLACADLESCRRPSGRPGPALSCAAARRAGRPVGGAASRWRTPTPRSVGPHSCWRCTRASGCSRPCAGATRSCSGSSRSWKVEGVGPAGRPARHAGRLSDARQSDHGPEKKKAKAAKATAPRPAEPSLDDADFEPLLQATASRALDTSLRGARGLAILGDPRAFGLLLQLSREEDKAARAEVCRAMAALADPRAAERLRSMLHDAEAEVRDAAFTAMARLHQADPLAAAESGLNASHEDVRRRGLQALVEQIRKTPKRAPRARPGAAGPRPQR